MTQTFAPASASSWRPDIDGLRAVAVVAVLVFHCFQDRLPGGFVGVDVFFVISGYLIGKIIFQDLQSGTFDFVDFHMRRIRRIFPALIATLLVSLAIGYVILLTDEYQQLGKHLAGGAGFVDNIVFQTESGYFDRVAEAKPLLHLWSLGVEEQFYIFWPLVMVIAWKYTGNIFWVLLTLVAASLLCCVTSVAPAFTWSFYSPIGRLWELGAGSILAYQTVFAPHFLRHLPTKASNAMSAVGAALLVSAVSLIDKNRQFPGPWTLLPVMGTFCIIAAGSHSWINRVILSRPQLVAVGLISYPLYLWHWPLLYFTRILSGPSPSTMALSGVIAASFMLSALTYFYIERPLRHSRNAHMNSVVLLAIMAGIAAAGGNISRNGIGGSLAQSYPLVGAAHNDNGADKRMGTMTVAGETLRTLGSGKTVTLFYGDSHVDQYMARFAEKYAADPQYGRPIAEFYASGCPPIPNIVRPNYASCKQSSEAVAKIIDDPAIDTVVIGGAWNKYFIDFPSRSTPGDYEDDYYYRSNGKDIFWGQGGAELAFQALGDFLKTTAAAKRVILILDNPHGDELDVSTQLDRVAVLRQHQDAAQPQDHILTQQELELRERLQQLAKAAGAAVIDPVQSLCADGKCPTVVNRRPVYVDTHHLSASYVKSHGDYIDAAVMPMMGP